MTNTKYILVVAITAVLVGAGIYTAVHKSPVAINNETKNPEVMAPAQDTVATIAKNLVQVSNVEEPKFCTYTHDRPCVETSTSAPVCVTAEVVCAKAPCNPVLQTYSNECVACRDHLTHSYVAGECTNLNKPSFSCPDKCPVYAPPAEGWCSGPNSFKRPPVKDSCGCLGRLICSVGGGEQ